MITRPNTVGGPTGLFTRQQEQTQKHNLSRTPQSFSFPKASAECHASQSATIDQYYEFYARQLILLFLDNPAFNLTRDI